jgi:tRNA(fMet)-specific endonuclease VapC
MWGEGARRLAGNPGWRTGTGRDLAVAEAHGQLLVAVRTQGRPMGAHDLIIAATAVAVDRVVVTSDKGSFADLRGVVARLHPRRS